MNSLHTKPTTLGDLKAAGWKSVSVKEEMRRNLIRMLGGDGPLFDGILGYEETVIPQMVNAVLSRHDMILLGLRGQAKTRILRSMIQFLDEFMPYVKGSELRDDPLNPITRQSKQMILDMGDDTPIEWLPREARYGEKLATPDTSVSDLIGDLDPIKAASRKLTLADEEVIHFGLIPRSNRGIFVINELPDLQPRIQVALLNIMQERDIQIRGFNIRIPLDVMVAFSANPEDYTNRGNIITPLKDRIDSQIITHYPRAVEVAREITRQEAWAKRQDGPEVEVPEFFRDLVEWVAFEARESEYVDQKSGVSTRMTITAMEQMLSAAEQRALRTGEARTGLRITDLYAIVPALTGKLELVYEGEQEGAIQVARHLIGKAVKRVFRERFPDPEQRDAPQKSRTRRRSVEARGTPEDNPSSGSTSGDYGDLLGWFAQGHVLDIPDGLTDSEYAGYLAQAEGLKELVDSHVGTPESESEYGSWMGLVLEGLHQHSKLGRQDMADRHQYSDLVGSVLNGLAGGAGELDDEEGYEDDDSENPYDR